jgi:hypothetical protein
MLITKSQAYSLMLVITLMKTLTCPFEKSKVLLEGQGQGLTYQEQGQGQGINSQRRGQGHGLRNCP